MKAGSITATSAAAAYPPRQYPALQCCSQGAAAHLVCEDLITQLQGVWEGGGGQVYRVQRTRGTVQYWGRKLLQPGLVWVDFFCMASDPPGSVLARKRCCSAAGAVETDAVQKHRRTHRVDDLVNHLVHQLRLGRLKLLGGGLCGWRGMQRSRQRISKPQR